MFGGSETVDVKSLWLVGVGDVDQSVLETAATGAAQTLPVDARIHPERIDPADFEGIDDELVHGLDLARYARKRSGRGTVIAVTDLHIGKPRGEPAFGLAMRRGLAWYLYKTAKRLVIFLGRSAVGRVQSATGE